MTVAGVPGSQLLDLSDVARARLSLGLTGLAVLSAVAGLAISRLALDDLGLAGGLHPLYWLGIIGIAIACIIETSRGPAASRPLILFQIAVWTAIVWLTPTVLEGTPRFRASYFNYGYVDPLVRGDGFDRTRFLYHNWPLFPILMAGIRALGVGPEFLMAAFPVVLMAVYIVLTGTLMHILYRPTQQVVGVRDGDSAGAAPGRRQGDLARSISSLDPRLLLVLLLLPVFNWTGQDYFSPQGLSFAFFLVLLLILASATRRPEARLTRLGTIAVLVVFTLIVASHVLTSLFALAVLAVMVATRQIRPWTIFLTSAVIFFAWQVYVAAPFYVSYGDRLVEGLLNLDNFLERTVAGRVSGAPGHALVAQLRILATALIVGLGLAAAATQWTRRRSDRTLGFSVAYLIGVAVVIPTSIYGGESLIRGLLFSLPILLVLIVRAMDRRAMRIAVAAALLVGVPLHIYTHFGNEEYDYVSAAELEVFDKVANLAPANIYGGYPAGVYLETARIDSRNASLPHSDAETTVQDFLDPEKHNWADETRPTYVVLTRGDEVAVRLFRGEPDLIDQARAALEADRSFVVVFRNQDGVIYGRTAPVTATNEGP